MTGRFLLDTNIIIALFARETQVEQRLAGAAEVFIPSIVLGELYYGARQSGRSAANIARIDQFAQHNTILACTQATAEHYGQVKSQLRSKGRPIPENDIWIAALALQHDLVLTSRDAHFAEVDGLALEPW